MKFHYTTPEGEERRDFYNWLYTLWFDKHPANVDLEVEESLSILKTFTKGGYYAIDVRGYTFLTLNSLYWSDRNQHQADPEAQAQLDWLLDQLENASDDKTIIISFHVFPGPYYPGYDQTFWLPLYTNQFRDMMETYQDKILLVIGAHTHFLEFRGDWDPDPFYALLSAPAISPEYGNNPGFTTFELSGGRVVNLEFTFLDLKRTYGENSSIFWHKLRAAEALGMQELSPTSIHEFWKRLKQDKKLFERWQEQRSGHSVKGDEGMKIFEKIGMVDDEKANSRYFCFLSNIVRSDYDACVQAEETANSLLHSKIT